RFVAVERALMRPYPLWAPPIEADVVRLLQGRSPKQDGVEHAMFVVANGRDVARCTAFVNRRWQRHHGRPAGFVGHFAAAPDAVAEVRRLLAAAEAWLAGRGATIAIAGYDGVCGNCLGIRTAEFERAPLSPEPWHPPHYARHLEAWGHEPSRTWVSWHLGLRDGTLRSMSELATRRALCSVRPLDKARWDSEVATALHVFNVGFDDSWDYYPITLSELAEELAPFRSLV